MSQITYERVQELESDLEQATAWAEMRTEEVARLEARLTQLGESPEAIERAKTTPRVRDLLDAYAAEVAEVETEHHVFEAAVREPAAPKAFAALRAVLDLHWPDDGDCAECGVDTHENPIPWPCDTVRAIATALEAP